jgi:hypothetical protein
MTVRSFRRDVVVELVVAASAVAGLHGAATLVSCE